jgi:hypothetical protein
VKVQLDLAIHDPPQTFDQGGRFVIGLAPPLNLSQRRARKNSESGLMNDLVPRVELGNDEMDG